jgi:hypothetical protein
MNIIMACALVFLGAGAWGETVYLTRAYAEPARLLDDLATYDFDVADAAPGEYFELVASPADLDVLRTRGI